MMEWQKKNTHWPLFLLIDAEEPLFAFKTCAGFGGGLNDGEAFEEPWGFVPPNWLNMVNSSSGSVGAFEELYSEPKSDSNTTKGSPVDLKVDLVALTLVLHRKNEISNKY